MIEAFTEPLEETLTKAFARLAVIDSRRWISFLLDILPRLDDIDFNSMTDVEKRMMQMFYITVWGKAADTWDSEEVLDNLYALSDSTVLLSELISLLQYRFEQIDFIDEPVDLGFYCPLDLHCTYTRDQLLVAMDFMKPATVREGVKWLQDKQLDVFFVTLNKGRQGLFAHNHVQRLLHQREPVPLAEPEYHSRQLVHRPAIYPPQRTW